MLPFQNIQYIHIWKADLTENGNIHLFAEMENGNGKFHLGAANRNGQQKMVHLGRQMRNGNRQLLFHQTVPSMLIQGNDSSPRLNVGFTSSITHLLLQGTFFCTKTLSLA